MKNNSRTKECGVIKEANIPQPNAFYARPIVARSQMGVRGRVRNCVTEAVWGELDVLPVQHEDDNAVFDVLPICREYWDATFRTGQTESPPVRFFRVLRKVVHEISSVIENALP